jgi:hypothetical protein
MEAFALPAQTARRFLRDDKQVLNEKRAIVYEEKIQPHIGSGK